MPTTLDPAPKDVHDLIAKAKSQWHPELVECEVTIDALMATVESDSESESDQAAVRLHGYPVLAVIRIVPYKQRVHGIADAELTIDALAWRDMPEPERLALLDHELSHIEVSRDKEGFPKSDRHGRPALKMRLHDVQAGWFADVARRHGEHSQEVKQARRVVDDHGQTLFAWMAGGKDVIPMPEPRRKAAGE